MTDATALPEIFGSIDIYLFDQILRGRIPAQSRILDAGCGRGRNVHYLLREGYDVSAIDADPAAVAHVSQLASRLNPAIPSTQFRHEPVEALSFGRESMDVVLSIAVLHFARDDRHFEAMMGSMWATLRPGGLFFCRLASDIGMETRMVRRQGRRYLLPDGSERYLVDEARLLACTDSLGGTLLDPLKTTIVQDQRCMTTWVLRKNGSAVPGVE